MAYKPGTILVINFGEFAGSSIAQIPLKYHNGYRHVAGYLSRPERTDADGYKIGDDDLEYVRAVADAFRKFPVRVKCKGAYGSCTKKEIATSLVLPYDRTCNHPEKIKNGAPERVKQLYVPQSRFCCEHCAGMMEEDKRSGRDIEESGVLKMDISFRLPLTLIGSERREWNVDRTDLHRKFRNIAYQLTMKGINDVIDPAEAMEECVRMTKKASQEIVNKLYFKLEGIPEEELAGIEYDEPRELEWHIPTTNERWELMHQQIKKPRIHIHRERPEQMQLFAHS